MALSIPEARELDRANTMEARLDLCRSLIQNAETTESHWLAFNIINAAREIWGKSHDEDFDMMAATALRRARSLQDAWHETRKSDPPLSPVAHHRGEYEKRA